MSDLVLALDVGGTKVAAGLVDGDGVVRHRFRRPMRGPDGDWSADELWASVSAVVAEAVAAAGGPVAGVGVGCAGPVRADTGTVSPLNIPAWQDFPLVDRLRRQLGDVEVRLAGDVLCLALGEYWRGAGRDSRYLLGLVVSTGVGGGLVLDGRPYGGRTGNAGHVGHVIVEPDGLPCGCGGRGCVETVAAGPHLVRWARAQGWSAAPDADAAVLAADAVAGADIPRAAFARAGHAVGLGIAATAAALDLDLVVLGGGVAQAGDLLLDPIRRVLDTHARLTFLHDLRVVPAQLGPDAALVGAAALLVDN